MNPSYEDYLDQTVARRYRKLEMDIMRDIVRRIQKTGKITSSADWQILRLTIMGNSTEEIRKMIKEAAMLSEKDIQKLYDDVIEKEYTRNADLYKAVGADFIPYEQNAELQQLTKALVTQTNNDLESITGTTGFMLDYGDGQGLRFTIHTQIFDDYLNNAVMGIASGAFDYNTMIRRTVTQMTNSGLRTVDYASGRTDRVDVAARRAILTGLSQLSGKISDDNAAKLHTDYFEIQWHAGARPTHQVWQGRVWSKKELVDVCGLGTAAGLLGVNCYHSYYPFIPGVSERMYPDEWLEKMNIEENTPKSFMGKDYTAYEARQYQRYMERCMRAQREKVELLKEGGADDDDVMLARCKYQAMLDQYKRFSKAMKLPEQRERIYYDMRGRIAPTQKQMNEFLAKQAEKAAKGEKAADPTKNLDAAYKAQRNRKADERQFERYRSVLGDLVPGSIDAFQEMKYNNISAWNSMKHDYRIVNSYEINAGSMTPQKILQLDDIAFSGKKGLFTGKAKSSANIAVMELDGVTYYANSRATYETDWAYKNFKGNKDSLILMKSDEERKFSTLFIGTHDRRVDSEAKLFEYAADIADDGEHHTIRLLSERCMCDSCLGVMRQFQNQYSNVKVDAASGRRDRAEKNKNNPWKYRK